jgi:hypothetical protein
MGASPAAIIKPRPVSPVPPSSVQGSVPDRYHPVVARKSVSPRPTSSGTDFTTPFSPDSFDALNPNAHKSATSLLVNTSNGTSPYGTPGSSSGGHGLKLDQSVRQSPFNTPDRTGDEPIRDFHGNVVDPSDHLPVDCWAPEPERKGFSFKPQITPRPRDRLNGARSLGSSPAGSTENTSPHAGSVAGSTTTTASLSMSSAEPVSLGSSLLATVGNSRNKLQKRHGRPQSAIVPASTHVPLHGPGASAGAGNYPYVNAVAKRGSYHPGVPPVPAKIPLDRAGGGSMDRLNDEMSQIDIGFGPGAMTKRERKGFGFGFE